MSNRFFGLIRSGSIDTVSDLKLLFRRLAKETHPDLGVSGAHGGDFIRLREEYDAVLSEFDRHRFGAARNGHLVVDRRALYLALEALFGRGFPKIPRHEKEKQRYDYARFAFLENMKARDRLRGEEMFRSFERGLFIMRSSYPGEYGSIKSWIVRLMEYHRSGIAALAVELKIGAHKFTEGKPDFSGFPETPDSRGTAGVTAFILFLAADLDKGPCAMAVKEGGQGGRT